MYSPQGQISCLFCSLLSPCSYKVPTEKYLLNDLIPCLLITASYWLYSRGDFIPTTQNILFLFSKSISLFFGSVFHQCVSPLYHFQDFLPYLYITCIIIYLLFFFTLIHFFISTSYISFVLGNVSEVTGLAH